MTRRLEEVANSVLAGIRSSPQPQASVEDMTTTAAALDFDLRSTENDKTRRQCEAMINGASKLINGIKSNRQPFWLSLLGKSGNGKTYLAKKVWRWFKASPEFKACMDGDLIIYPGSFVFWPRLAAELLSNDGYGELADLCTEKLVVLDEIGSDRDPSGHVRDCLARLLTSRVGKWTIITSNKSLGEIQRDIDTRISSRMLRDGSLVVDVDMLDYNLRKQ